MSDKRATIIYNPMSGRPGRRAEDVQRMIGLLGERGIEADAKATAGPGDASKLAREAVAGVDIVISFGGDGTLNEVIQGMAGSHTALVVWPGGTSNVVARDLEVPFDIKELADMIAAGKTRRIALGLALGDGGQGLGASPNRLAIQPPTPSPQPLRRYFVMMAGIGLDASIARGVNKKLKRRTGEFAYWLSGIRHLFLWRAEPFSIEVDGHSYKGAFALIGNGKGYGGGMMMTPGARLEEPWFEVYILPPLTNNFAYLRALRACMRGKPEVAGVSLVRGKHIKANSAHE
ncbi:MAG TPA: diacylglycerol kinase family protein, partial [Blastocatellia bacterium]|nr:diacylglycerol kinase family protein [Blastocatellia bacterium]